MSFKFKSAVILLTVFSLVLFSNISVIRATLIDYCDNNSGCDSSNHEICDNNVCRGEEGALGCSEDVDCKYLRCINRVCGVACSRSDGCSAGKECVGGVCVERSVVSDCTNDADCGSGRHCAASNCADGNIGDPCDNQSDCDAGTCWGGQCRTSCSGPDDTTTCGSGRTCNGSNVCTDNQCNSSSDCPANNTCNLDHRCVNNDRVDYGNGGGNGGSGGGGSGGDVVSLQSPINIQSPTELVAAVLRGIMDTVGLASVAAMVYAGILYFTSGGSDEQAGKAKKTMTYAIIGLVIAILSYVIINTLINVIGG